MYKYQVPSILWGLLILFLCTYPGSGIPHIQFVFIIPLDKLIHIFLYLGLSCLLLCCNSLQYGTPVLRSYFVKALSIALLYGIAIEFIQERFCSGRSFEWMDVLADGAGTILGMILFLVMQRSKRYNRLAHLRIKQ